MIKNKKGKVRGVFKLEIGYLIDRKRGNSSERVIIIPIFCDVSSNPKILIPNE